MWTAASVHGVSSLNSPRRLLLGRWGLLGAVMTATILNLAHERRHREAERYAAAWVALAVDAANVWAASAVLLSRAMALQARMSTLLLHANQHGARLVQDHGKAFHDGNRG